jgi:hypothetical protein
MKRKSKIIHIVLIITWCLFLIPSYSQAASAVSQDELKKIADASPAKATAVPAGPRKLLVFGLCNGFRHSSIPYWDEALTIMGRKTGAYEVTISNDMSVFKPESLNRFDAVCLNNTTQLKFDAEAHESLMAFIKGGKGIAGIHAATDNFYDWPEAAEMFGGQFSGHPWTADGTWAIKIDDPKHTLMAAFDGKGFKINDEIYRTDPPLYSRSKQRVLMSLDMSDDVTANVSGVTPDDADTGISWVKSYGKGRLFYCSLGHNHQITWTAPVLQHVLDGIQFVLGDLPCDTTASVMSDLPELMSKVAAYDYGQSRKPLSELSDIIRDGQGSPELLSKIENEFVTLLQSDTTPAGKGFICRELSIIGTGRSVPVLVGMLTEPETSDMARYALERIPDPAVDDALRATLPKSTGNERIGIINALGMRGDRKSVAVLKDMIDNPETMTAAAVVSALGRIAGPQAAAALAQAKSKTTGQLQLLVLNAYLQCADDMVNNGNQEDALKIYHEIYNSDAAENIRIAALRGMVATQKNRAGEIIVRTLNQDNQAMQTAAVKLLGEVPGEKTQLLENVAAELPNLSAAVQVQLLAALADAGNLVALPAVVSATKSTDEAVRVAALTALAKLPDSSNVGLLTQVAVESTGAEQETARASLYDMPGSQIDETIISAIAHADPKAKAELVRSISQRNMYSGMATLLKTAQDPDSNVRMESLRALKTVAKAEDLPALVNLLVQIQNDSDRTEAERTIIVVVDRISEQSQRNEAILAVLPSVEEDASRASLLNVLGKIADDSALPSLRNALRERGDKVRDAAVRALSEWPNSKPIDAMLAVAKTSDKKTHRVLALRGYVRMIGLGSRPTKEMLNMYDMAMKISSDVSEKKTVFSGLAKVKRLAAMEMAVAYLDDEELQDEAALAVAGIAQAVCGSYPEQSKDALEKVLKISQNEALRKQAMETLSCIEQLRSNDNLIAWEVSGPYSKAGSRGLFETVFAPEEPDAKEVAWEVMPALTNKNQPWLLDLSKLFRKDNCAAYLRNKVWSDKNQKVRLELGSDDGINVWLNGQLVHSNNANRGVTLGADKVEVTLNKGWNTLMLKITNGSGEWGACARIRALDGGKIEGLRAAVDE